MVAEDNSKNLVNSVVRACSLVELIAANGPDVSLSHAAEVLSLSRSTTHRLLNTLVTAGWVRHTDGGRYALTTRLFTVGALSSPISSLRELARPHVRNLAEATGDTVYMFVPDGDSVLCIERMEGAYPVRVHNVNVGDVIDRLLGAAPQAMARARTGDYDGYVVSRNNATPGVSAVGAAIFGRDGQVVAGVSVTAVDARLTDDHLTEAVTHVRATAAEISRALGYLGETS